VALAKTAQISTALSTPAAPVPGADKIAPEKVM